MMRKRENEKIKKEKDDAIKERERLRLQIAEDKRIRQLNKGVLPSALGVDGYNPSAIQYDSKLESSHAHAHGDADAKADHKGTSSSSSVSAGDKKGGASSSSAAAPAPAPAKKVASSSSSASTSSLSKEEIINKAIDTISKYKTGGDGGNALKLLITFVKNVIDNPTQAKFRSINTESAAYKNKLQPFIGTSSLLKAVGFAEEEGKLRIAASLADGQDLSELDGGATTRLLQETCAKLVKAEETFRAMCPA